MLSPAGKERIRPTTSRFCTNELCARWEPFAQLKQLAWRWDGDSYPEKNRQSYGDHDLLVMHKPALMELLRLAPTGFPAHGNLRTSLLILEKQWNIFDLEGRGLDKLSRDVHAWQMATAAADVWRMICRHLYNRARDSKTSDALEPMLSLIELPIVVKASPTSVAMTNVSQLESMFPTFELGSAGEGDDDDDEPEITHEKCCCPGCTSMAEAQAIEIQSDEDVDAAHDLLLLADPPIPDPRTGMQKKFTCGQEHDQSMSAGRGEETIAQEDGR